MTQYRCIQCHRACDQPPARTPVIYHPGAPHLVVVADERHALNGAWSASAGCTPDGDFGGQVRGSVGEEQRTGRQERGEDGHGEERERERVQAERQRARRTRTRREEPV